ncbi:unnamed protein product [Phytophthora fragariaefolia]|uniref:Unnamed protein product n=1 Tax=Phytophthora fragariaefolia TaxID=1490495 RepID=A0A9W7D2M0_9STRA|nr:unnamed protein product [Phytophthora fragariaefolia]
MPLNDYCAVSLNALQPPYSPSPRSRPSPLKTGRPLDDIWKHSTLERESGKNHGRCNYCGVLKKNGKPSGNLLTHLTKPNQCPNVSRDVQLLLRQLTAARAAPTTAPATAPTVEPARSELDQDTFDLALAPVFFACALPFILIEAQVFRDFIAYWLRLSRFRRDTDSVRYCSSGYEKKYV